MKLIKSFFAFIVLLIIIVMFGIFLIHKPILKKEPIMLMVEKPSTKKIRIYNDITIENYFSFIDSLVIKYDSVTPYQLTEHLLVRANPWIIDTLKNTDYYIQKARDSFIYNQKKMIVLNKGIELIIPNLEQANEILSSFKKTKIDVNIPEFKLRIYEDSIQLFSFLVRVGKDTKRFLKMSDRVQDLKTITGKGTIVGYNRYPDYYNPVNSHRYFVTNRDDKRITKLPQVPFIKTQINGVRNGQLIHVTTNPNTLGKAYSNGCIGTEEGNVWVIYYYAPFGTKITIRYDLTIKNKKGKDSLLVNVYDF
jgi:hypothetical protein